MVVTLDTGDQVHYLDWRAALEVGSIPALPPLLMLHGLLGTAWAWAPVARRLAPLTPTIAADLRGHGLSDAPRGSYDLETLAYDCLTVMSAIGWGSDAGGPAVVVAGHGLGAMVGATMALVRPQSVAGLALIDGGWEHMAEVSGMDAAEYGRTIGDPPEVLASMEAYLADRRDYDPASWDADQQRAARAAIDEKHAGHVTPVVRAHAQRGTIEAMWEHDPAAGVGLVNAPILALIAESGSADDEATRERRLALDELIALRRARGLPAATVVRCAGAGHNLMRYRPAELSTALLDLLRLCATSDRRPDGPD